VKDNPEAVVPVGFPAQAKATVSGDSRERWSSSFIALIGLATATAVLLRWYGLGSQSLWLDEGITFWTSGFSPRSIWHILELDTTNPLYYFALHYWRVCFGTSEFSLRSLSAFFATASIPLFFLTARKVLRDRWSIALAMVLYAVSFLQVWYAQEARCYALLAFLSVGSIYWSLLCLEKRTALRLLGLAIFLTAGLYTHNIALFYLPGLGLLWLLYPSPRTLSARIKDGLIVGLLVLPLYLPWLSHLQGQVRRIQMGWWVATPRPQDLLETLSILLGFDVYNLQQIFRSQFHTPRLFGFWTWAPAVLAVFLLCMWGGLLVARPADRRKVLALVAYCLTPVLLVFGISHISNSIYLNRAFLGSCVLLPIVLCAPVAFQAGRRRMLFQAIVCLILVGTALSAFGYLRRERREDWRGVTLYLLQLPEKERLAVIVPDVGQILVDYYAKGMFKSYPPIEMTGLLTNYIPPDPNLEARSLERLDQGGDMSALLAQAMASGKYKEIDVVMQPGTLPVLTVPTLGYLSAHCGALERVQFHWLEVRRCFVEPTVRNRVPLI